MALVLCVSSQTVFGPVGNSVAVPVLQAAGHEVMQLPTVLLSNHPGHGKPIGQATPAAMMQEMLSAVATLNGFDGLSGVMTGYFASAAQVIAVAKQIAVLKEMNPLLHVLVDPVIGDHGTLYVAIDVAEAIRDQLLPLATITTPNLFELTWLAGRLDINEAVKKLHTAETIVTSVPEGDNALATLLVTADETQRHLMPRHQAIPNGTGDYLAGCYLAQRLNTSSAQAFAMTMQKVEKVIEKSRGSRVLRFS